MERNERWRPAPGGVSIGHPDITAGTLGAYLWLDGKAYIVSNSHVIANSGLASLGDPVLQPGSFDGGEEPQDSIGRLSAFKPFDTRVLNKVDVAVAEADPAAVDDRILGLGPWADVRAMRIPEMSVGDTVVKSGRTSGFTDGKILSLDARVRVYGYPQGTVEFEDCMVVEGAVEGGDSGSVVLSVPGGSPVGLLFSGVMGEYYVACKMSNVLDWLGEQPGFRELGGAQAGMGWLGLLLGGGIVLGDIWYFLRRKRGR